MGDDCVFCGCGGVVMMELRLVSVMLELAGVLVGDE